MNSQQKFPINTSNKVLMNPLLTNNFVENLNKPYACKH